MFSDIFLTVAFVAFVYGYYKKKKEIKKQKEQEKHRKIVCAALRFKSGLIITGVRHFDKIMSDQIEVLLNCGTLVSNDVAEQGFVDSYGAFLDRTQAYRLAEKNGQLNLKSQIHLDELYSENLY